MKRIPLTNSDLYALVDDCQFEKAMKLKWYLGPKRAMSTTPPYFYLCEFLFGPAPKGFEWDHENRNSLDDQRHNLRYATSSQNKHNRKVRRDSSSGFIGVHFVQRRGKYEAYIHLNSHRVFLGYFDSPEKAARARDAVAFRHHGKFVVLNFPIIRLPRLGSQHASS